MSGRGSDDDDGGVLSRGSVWGIGVGRITVERRARRFTGERGERDRADEAGGVGGEDGSDVIALLAKQPQQFDGLVGGYAAGNA